MKKHAYVRITIPTNQEFLKQQFNWTHGKVARHFKRDKERIFDTVQNVRLRLLTKDFIGRWFFKHLTDELVNKGQAEFILGGKDLTAELDAGVDEFKLRSRLGDADVNITWTSNLPLAGVPNLSCERENCMRRRRSDDVCVRSCPNSLWRISDILAFAKYDHERFYYSIQGHTINSAKTLRMLGYPEDQYSLLQSMYRQGRLRPAELTEHSFCSGSKCQECEHGRELLRDRKLSLAHNWSDPDVAFAASKLRWNDSQLRPFLREWRQSNRVKKTPIYIMRTDIRYDVNAGLYKYAETIIDNEVVNDFKRISRSDDIQTMVFNNGQSPELSDSDTVALESDRSDRSDRSPDETVTRVLRDTTSLSRVARLETQHDFLNLVRSSDLTDEESLLIRKVELDEISIREFSQLIGKSVQKVHSIRQSALAKLHRSRINQNSTSILASSIAQKYDCDVSDMLSGFKDGRPATARSEFFTTLQACGMTVHEISELYGIPEHYVTDSIGRVNSRDIGSFPLSFDLPIN